MARSETRTRPPEGEPPAGATPGQTQSGVPADTPQKEAPSRIGLVASLDDVPAVAAYLRRAGARAINFRTAKVEEEVNGYPKASGGIEFKDDGTASVWGKVEAPTPEEEAAIKRGFAQVEFPKMSTLAAIGTPPPGVNISDAATFICHDFADQIVMVQQRYEKKDGGKGFLPWTFWSDGQWRQMEPDPLPFYGLPGAKNHGTLFIHEGAKAAARVKRILAGEDDARFPWREEMRWGHHIGWLGGTHAVDSSEWGKLAALGWKRVVIVADNDSNNKGIRAARRIAHYFPANVFILAFDQRFKDGFDLGDDWPDSLFDERGAYTGPALLDCLLSATQATMLIPAEGRGRPTAVTRPEFAATVAFTTDPPRFISLHQPSRDRSADEFNATVAPFSDVKDTATKVLAEAECYHDKLIWDPSKRAGTIHRDGLRCFNVYDEPRIVARKGDAGPWLDFISHLVPNAEEREHLCRWLATLIAKPEVRMRWGILLISEAQGVGKGTLGVILRKMLGAANVSFPGTKDISESAFNGWIARRRLAFVSELYSGHSRKTYDDLKAVMTDDFVTVNTKHTKHYEIDNWLHIIACSNSTRALHIDLEDRRWLVPTVTEQARPPEAWADLYAWLEGYGPGIILRWARDYVAGGDYVRTGEHAPRSLRKAQIAEKSQSDGAKLAVELAEHLVGLDRPVILRLSTVREWIARQRGFRRSNGEADVADRRLEKDDTLLRAMKNVPGIRVWANNRRPKFGGVKDAVVMNFSPAEDATWPEVKDRLTTIEGVHLDEQF